VTDAGRASGVGPGAVAARHPLPRVTDVARVLEIEARFVGRMRDGAGVPPGSAPARPTNDPAQLRKGGALLPLGGAEGYKGYGLAAMVEIFSGLLTGLGFGVEPTGRHNDGCFIAVFNVAAFRDLTTFKREVTEFAGYLNATPPAAGFDRVYYPGEIEFEREKERRANGIPIESMTGAAT